MKPIPAYWALFVGLLSVAYQVINFYIRFGGWNTEATFADYWSFFLAGSLGGLVLILFLNRQTTVRGRRIVLIAFGLAFPLAMFMMLGGGLLGALGIVLLPQIPWALFTWLGSMLGRSLARS